MNDETVELEDNSFVAVAMRHGLLERHHVEKILDHSLQANVQPSDAALSLSMLELYEVDAINLLCRPESLAPGYALTGLMGCGAGGMVFRAHQNALGRDVALKTINVRSRNASTTGQSRMQREAHAIASLHHPHIVTAFDSGFHQGRFFIAMELVEGETLAEFIRRQSPIPEDVTWLIARQVASALSHANDAGITHRDIKPANLLLSHAPAGTNLPPGVPFVKVADFGLAFESQENDASQITATGTTLGTPAYVSPEQLHDTHVDARADIYSMGATVYHMLTGLPPCSDRSAMRTIMQKSVGDDRWRDEIDASVSKQSVALFRDMTETNPEDRIADYEELISRIDELVDIDRRSSPKTRSAVRRNADATHDRRMKTKGFVTIVLIVVGITAAIAYSHSRSTEVTEANEAAEEWIVDGFPQPLFNGESVPLFRQSGSWSPGVASDGSRVLVGSEGSQMTIPLTKSENDSPNLRLRFGLRLSVDSVVEVSFMHSDQSTQCGVLRFDGYTAAFRSSASSPDSDSSTSMTFSPSPNQDPIFQSLTFQRTKKSASLTINGDPIGNLPCDASSITSIKLRCIKNAATFADIDIVRLSPL
ncbi:Serine/threonine-protein kinase PknL [Rubripirellula obstinata]|uniref:Serine/threonine-protein kinase PknL n=1 Tax=Rubripirellula obstinata TaxID=406547 RepID=A0A5B1CLY6_9BACT|nr:serine/threonine-protein kinase [Rubripirellula obstinata]KAA1261291.1 Serine/threonine-protein kinase PknL [Rubripirellula obstinata]